MIKFKAKTPKSNASRRFSDMFVRVAVIFSATAVLAVMSVSMVNDSLSLFKRRASAQISASNADELVRQLEKEGIIDHPWLFSAYMKFKGEPELDGSVSVSVNSEMDYGQILSAFDKKDAGRIKRITFPEGATTDEMIDMFVKNGMGSRERFIEVINSYPFEYEFVSVLDGNVSNDRKYRLDGYLYPDTYDFYTGRSEAYYIYKLLDRFDVALKQLDVSAAEIDKTVIIASMIQSSGDMVGQYEYLSAVFNNRLKSPDKFPYLNCPATGAYAAEYDTFLNKGLPPGAICNPDMNALICAARPAKSDYKYFVTMKNGEVLFATTETGHRQNLAKADG